MLQTIAKFYEKYLPANPTADAFARVVRALEPDSWVLLLSRANEVRRQRNKLPAWLIGM